MCSNTLTDSFKNADYILVTTYGNQITRHYNPMNATELLEKLKTDDYNWTYLGQYKIKITFENTEEA